MAAEGTGKAVCGARRLKDLVGLLRRPRAVMLLVPAGPIVDAGHRRPAGPLWPKGDLIIDGGNSHLRRHRPAGRAAGSGASMFLGVGVSGGEEGARRGPSLMPGGPREAYERVRPIFEAIAAKADGEPCVTYLGPGSAGHYVKMVHNGIEYGLMRLIAETYDLMKRGLGSRTTNCHDVFAAGTGRNSRGSSSRSPPTSSSRPTTEDRQAADRRDPRRGGGPGHGPVDLRERDGAARARAHHRHGGGHAGPLRVQAVPRGRGPDPAAGPSRVYRGKPEELVDRLESALYVGVIVTYAQGMVLLAQASEALGYGLRLDEVARIWRGGCIIRSRLLDDVRAAYREEPDLADLLADRRLAGEVQARQGDLRAVVTAAADLGIPVPGLMACLAYIDSLRSPWLPGQPHPGAARLLRGPHVSSDRHGRHVPYPVGQGLRRHHGRLPQASAHRAGHLRGRGAT